MQENYGPVGPNDEVAARLRGNGAEESIPVDPNLRSTQNQTRLGGPVRTQGNSQHHEIPKDTDQEVQEAPAKIVEAETDLNWNSGHIEPARPEEVERWILEGLQRRARGRGRAHIPEDLFDFSSKATVTFLDADNRTIKFVRVVATWEDDG